MDTDTHTVTILPDRRPPVHAKALNDCSKTNLCCLLWLFLTRKKTTTKNRQKRTKLYIKKRTNVLGKHTNEHTNCKR